MGENSLAIEGDFEVASLEMGFVEVQRSTLAGDQTELEQNFWKSNM